MHRAVAGTKMVAVKQLPEAQPKVGGHEKDPERCISPEELLFTKAVL